MNEKRFGIDLGTKQIKIYRQSEGIVLKQINQVAIEKRTHILAYGDEAYEMYEKAPEAINVSYPMRNGVIADFSNMKELLELFMKNIGRKRSLGSKDFYIAVPTDITDVEKRAFFTLVESAGVKAKHVYVVEKPIADALGIGIDVNTPKGVMIVNFGGDTTEISVISLGGIVISKLIQIGGNKIDEAIVMYVKKQKNVIIGMKSAEELKMNLADAMNDSVDSMSVLGRDLVSGLPVTVKVDSNMIYEAVNEYFYNIIDSVKIILERTPPELASDIIDSGIYLTGGCSQIKGLANLISKETDLKANLCDAPEDTVINGIGKIIENPELQELAHSMNQPVYD